MGDGGVAVFRDIQRQTDRAATAAQRPAFYQAIRIRQDHFVIGGEVQQAFVEQRPTVQAIGRQGQGHVIDALEAEAVTRGLHQTEIGIVDGPPFGVLVDQIDQAAIGRTHRSQLALVRSDQAAVRLAMESHRARQRLGAVLDPDCRGAQGRAMAFEKVVGKRIRLGVEDQVDIALAQQTDILRAMGTGTGEAQAFQPVTQLGAEGVVNGKFKKLDAIVGTGWRWREQ
ncbi:hypothetical protein D3C79_775490 [compost metagenome]